MSSSFFVSAVSSFFTQEVRKEAEDLQKQVYEIDFIGVRGAEKIYIQVCIRLPDDSDRETANLMEIRDHYPKYVVLLQPMDMGVENGIMIVHISDFRLSWTRFSDRGSSPPRTKRMFA